MAGTNDNHNTNPDLDLFSQQRRRSKSDDLDDLFQVLIARNYLPFDARIEIDNALCRGKLRVDEHVRAGVRKTSPTPEGHKAAIEGRSADVTYEISPPGGITEPVNPQCWGGRVLDLTIRDGRLIVTPRCSLEWPWEAISFAIANPVVIDELWPRAVSNPLMEVPPEQVPPPQTTPPSKPSKPPKPKKKKIPAARWLKGRFRPLDPGEAQTDYLDGLYEDMQKDPNVKVCKFHTLATRYSEFLSSPQTVLKR